MQPIKYVALFERLLVLLVAVAGVLVPVLTTLNVYNHGPAPEKHIDLTRIGPIDPMRDLSSLYDSATLQLKFKDQTIDNIVVVEGIFKNAGIVPIVPADFVEKLSAQVTPPWKIVTVKNQGLGQVRLDWKRVNDQKFEAEPTLLNPGDVAWANVYVTNTKYQVPIPNAHEPSAAPRIVWNARIVNLKAFAEPPGIMERTQDRYKFIFVQLGGWWLWLTLMMALVSEGVYLHLLARAGLLRTWGWKPILTILAVTFLSFSVAEAVETYLDGNTLTDLAGVNHWLNVPPLVLQMAVILVLYFWKPAKKTRPSRSSLRDDSQKGVSTV